MFSVLCHLLCAFCLVQAWVRGELDRRVAARLQLLGIEKPTKHAADAAFGRTSPLAEDGSFRAAAEEADEETNEGADEEAGGGSYSAMHTKERRKVTDNLMNDNLMSVGERGSDERGSGKAAGSRERRAAAAKQLAFEAGERFMERGRGAVGEEESLGPFSSLLAAVASPEAFADSDGADGGGGGGDGDVPSGDEGELGGSGGGGASFDAFVPRDRSNYEAVLGLLKQTDGALLGEQQRAAQLELELNERKTTHEVALHEAQLGQLQLRKKLRRLEQASPQAELFELYEGELGKLQAELARARAENVELQCTCRDAALHIEALSGGGGDGPLALSPPAVRGSAADGGARRAAATGASASSVGVLLEGKLNKVRSWRRALALAEREKAKLQEQLAEMARGVRGAEAYRKAAEESKRKLLKLSREHERQSRELLALQLAKTELAGRKQKLDEHASQVPLCVCVAPVGGRAMCASMAPPSMAPPSRPRGRSFS